MLDADPIASSRVLVLLEHPTAWVDVRRVAGMGKHVILSRVLDMD